MVNFPERIRRAYETEPHEQLVHFVGSTTARHVAIFSKMHQASIEGGPDFFVVTAPVNTAYSLNKIYAATTPKGRIWLPGALSLFAETDRGPAINVLFTFTPDEDGSPVPPLVGRELAVPAPEAEVLVPITPLPETEAALIALHMAARNQTPPGAV